MVTWKDGKVVWVPPEEIEIDVDSNEPTDSGE
jgi:hypothetical protein